MKLKAPPGVELWAVIEFVGYFNLEGIVLWFKVFWQAKVEVGMRVYRAKKISKGVKSENKKEKVSQLNEKKISIDYFRHF